MVEKRVIVVVGGVAAGAGAAAKARREDETAQIIVYEKGDYVSFANCGLPYYVGDEITEQESLLLHTPQSLKERFNLDIHVQHEVVEVIPHEHRVVVRKVGTDETLSQHYDKLVLAMGARPIVPPIPGIRSNNVQLLRTVGEAESLKRAIVEGRIRRAVVVGGGFIGIEAAENMARQHVTVTLVEKLDQVMPPFDKEMVMDLQASLVSTGINLVLGNGVKQFLTRGEEAYAVELEDGSVVEADAFLLSIGVRPDVSLAQAAGIELGASGAIAVNDRMETSIPDIYAAGDAVEFVHLVNNKPTWIPLAGPANKQGRVAGANAVGRSMSFKGAYGTSIVRFGKTVAAKTGFGEKECQRHSINYRVTYTYHQHHASYYPGSEGMMIKLISEAETGRILGAQISGGAGVDKRIDVIATAIYGNMTVEDLENLDLAYAPPFGAAKDPIIMAGMTHANLFRAEGEAATPTELRARLGEDGLQIVDVRNPNEWKKGMISGATGIPLPELRTRLAELDPNKETIVYCRSGQRSYFASRILQQSGFHRVVNLSGGYLSWTLNETSKETVMV